MNCRIRFVGSVYIVSTLVKKRSLHLIKNKARKVEIKRDKGKHDGREKSDFYTLLEGRDDG